MITVLCPRCKAEHLYSERALTAPVAYPDWQRRASGKALHVAPVQSCPCRLTGKQRQMLKRRARRLLRERGRP